MLTANEPALPTPGTAMAASWQTDTCSNFPAIPSCVLNRNPSRLRSQLERQHQSVPMLRSYCIACSANASNCSALRLRNQRYLKPMPTCVKTQNIPAGSQVSNQPTQPSSILQRRQLPDLPTTRTALPATPRMATSCTFHPTHRLCHASDSSIRTAI